VLQGRRRRCNQMSKRLPSPPAPGPLEDYAARFDDLFATLAQREGGSASTCEGCCCPEIATKPLPPSPERSPSSKPSKRPFSGCSSSCPNRVGMRKPSQGPPPGAAWGRFGDESARGWRSHHRRDCRPQGRKEECLCGASVPELRGQDRQRYRVGFERVGLP